MHLHEKTSRQKNNPITNNFGNIIIKNRIKFIKKNIFDFFYVFNPRGQYCSMTIGVAFILRMNHWLRSSRNEAKRVPASNFFDGCR